MEKVRIKVNARDIKLGNPGKATTCPIARAIRRKNKNWDIVVGVNLIYINCKSKTVSNPDKVFKWVKDFDVYRPVKPFSFTLYL